MRHLHSFLQERQLLKMSSLEEIRGRRIGIDAVYWLRGLPAYGDPLLGSTGEGSAALAAAIRYELDQFKKADISPLFVFRGIEPPGHRLFTQQHSQEEAWAMYYSRGKEASIPLFAATANRLLAEDERMALLLLKELGHEALQAAYLAPPQLSYLLAAGYIQAILGPPSVILFGVNRVITQIDIANGYFIWLGKEELLSALDISAEQLADSCLLAGTDYCLTFPYLNLIQIQSGASSSSFSFGTAVEFIRQAPMTSYLQQFPSPQMKYEHVDG